MRLFVDCRWFAQNGQGVVTYIARLHEAMLELPEFTNSDLTIVYGVPSIAKTDKSLLPDGVEIIEMGHRSFLWRLVAMPFWLRRNKIDVAHFQYVSPLYKLGMKYIVTIHDIIFISHPEYFSRKHRLSRLPFYYYSAHLADKVLTVSEQSRSDLGQHFGLNDAVVIHNAFPPDTLPEGAVPPRNIDKDIKYILTVGRVEPRKNYPTLVSAFENCGLSSEGYKLVIAGFCHDEFASEREKIASREGVIFLDYVTDENLHWLYLNASGFVYPSICEGFGIPVLEAMNYNLPCAVSETYPLEDIRKSVLVTFDPFDLNDISSSLKALAANLSKTSKPIALKERYSWENSARTYFYHIPGVASLTVAKSVDVPQSQ